MVDYKVTIGSDWEEFVLLMEFDTLADFMYTVCVHMASCIVHQQYWYIITYITWKAESHFKDCV